MSGLWCAHYRERHVRQQPSRHLHGMRHGARRVRASQRFHLRPFAPANAGPPQNWFTTRPVEERVAELNSATAVPGSFILEGVYPSSDPERHESVVHGILAECRVASKEFFRVDLAKALQTVSATCGPASFLRMPDLLNRVQRAESEETDSPPEVSSKARRWGESYIDYLERMRQTAH